MYCCYCGTISGDSKKRFVEETYFEVESFIALIVVQFEEIAEKGL